MPKVSLADILQLSIPERLQLVEDIWNSISESPAALPLTRELHEELDRRLNEFHKDPASGSPWHDVKRRIRSE